MVKRLLVWNDTNTLTFFSKFHIIPFYLSVFHIIPQYIFCKKSHHNKTPSVPPEKKRKRKKGKGDLNPSDSRLKSLRGKWRTKGKGDLDLHGRQTRRYQISTSTVRSGHLLPDLDLVGIKRGRQNNLTSSQRRIALEKKKLTKKKMRRGQRGHSKKKRNKKAIKKMRRAERIREGKARKKKIKRRWRRKECYSTWEGLWDIVLVTSSSLRGRSYSQNFLKLGTEE